MAFKAKKTHSGLSEGDLSSWCCCETKHAKKTGLQFPFYVLLKHYVVFFPPKTLEMSLHLINKILLSGLLWWEVILSITDKLKVCSICIASCRDQSETWRSSLPPLSPSFLSLCHHCLSLWSNNKNHPKVKQPLSYKVSSSLRAPEHIWPFPRIYPIV